MNKYQRSLNKASKQTLINHKLAIKLKYKDKWLTNGTPMNHPIYIAFEAEFEEPNHRQIRKYIKGNYKTLIELKIYIQRMAQDNAVKYFILFNEDIKYDNR